MDDVAHPNLVSYCRNFNSCLIIIFNHRIVAACWFRPLLKLITPLKPFWRKPIKMQAVCHHHHQIWHLMTLKKAYQVMRFSSRVRKHWSKPWRNRRKLIVMKRQSPNPYLKTLLKSEYSFCFGFTSFKESGVLGLTLKCNCISFFPIISQGHLGIFFVLLY